MELGLKPFIAAGSNMIGLNQCLVNFKCVFDIVFDHI